MKEIIFMKKIIENKNIIILIMAFVVVWTACGMSIDDYDTLGKSSSGSSVSYQVAEISNHFQSVKQENNNVVITIIKNISLSMHKSKVNGCFVAFGLLLLLTLFRLFQLACKLSYICIYQYRAYVIAYIHDLDGRKRLS